MRLIQLTLICLVAVTAFLFITGGRTFHLSRILPFCSGSRIDMPYEVGGLAMLGLFLWGLYRLNRNKRDE